MTRFIISMSTKRGKSDSTNPTKKRKVLTLQIKYDIIKDSEGGMKTREIAKKFNLPYTTVHTIITSKEKILDAIKNEQSLNSSLIRKRHGLIAEMEILLKTWCENQVNVENCPVDQTIICNKARQLFDKLKEEAGDEENNEHFVASNGWFCRFKQRCKWQRIGESAELAKTNQTAEDAVTLTKKNNVNDPDDINELLESHGAELAVDEITEMQEEKTTEDEEPESTSPLESMNYTRLKSSLDMIEKGMQILEEIDPNEDRVMTVRENIQRSIACSTEILRERKEK